MFFDFECSFFECDILIKSNIVFEFSSFFDYDVKFVIYK